MKWVYGIISHPIRFDTHLPRTIASLARAGFTDPIVFMDSSYFPSSSRLDKPVSFRSCHIGLFGNFSLALVELYMIEPNADRYLLFQDDIVSVMGLYEYLDRTCTHELVYWNLYTWPENMRSETGWVLSNQKGRGALGLVFSREALLCLLGSKMFWEHRMDAHSGSKCDDRAVITTMNANGYKEMVHNPSLLQHTGVELSVARNQLEVLTTPAFPGEDYDVCEQLLRR